MALEIIVIIVLILIIIVLSIILKKTLKSRAELEKQLDHVASRKQSLSTKYGRLTEQFAPFMESYPYNEHNFRFIGSPIDGVQFEDDKILFIEFKTADSALTKKQKNIKNIVEQGNVEFREFRIDEKKLDSSD